MSKDIVLVGGEIVFLLIALFLPFHGIVVDIFIVMNLLFAIMILRIALLRKEIMDFPTLPTLLLIFVIISIAVNISVVRLVLSMGADLNDWVIRGVSYLMAGAGYIAHLIAGSVVFIFTVVFVVIKLKRTNRMAEATARFFLDGMVAKNMSIDSELAREWIVEYEVMEKRKRVQKEVALYSAMDGVSKFVSGHIKIIIISIFVIILGGVLIEVLYRGEEIISAIKIYLPLSIGSGIVFLLPVFLVLAAVGFIFKK
ncbi:MAG: FHIPEP family type III secretion protein [Spirochaetaceae bacterium]|nr:FHIPEP family type III secretion protein [Spirochaetaceae bacterium]